MSIQTARHRFVTILGALLLALSLAGAAHASIIPVYGNTTLDLNSGLDLVGIYDAVGDSIGLSDASNPVTSARVAIYNVGSQGTADVTLQFFDVGAPVGAPIGSAYTVTNVDLVDNALTIVDFSLGSLSVPKSLVFIVSVSNVAGGVQPQLELFGSGPEVGSNTPNTAIVLNGVAYSQTDTTGLGGGNPYFQLVSATAVPEPADWLLFSSGAAALLGFSRWRKRNRTV
jgi:hypothetical protein